MLNLIDDGAWDVRLLNNLANIEMKELKYDKAEKYFLESLKIFKQLSIAKMNKYYPLLAGNLHNLGNLYRNINNYELAKKY